MRLRDALPVLLLAMVSGATGCRSMMIPDYKRQGAEQVAQDYRVYDDAKTKQRISARAQLGLAGQRLQSGDLKSAETEARAALKKNPSSADAFTLLAVIADRRNDQVHAGELYRRAAELAPSEGGVLNNYGAWLCTNGYPAEALPWFDRALAAPGYSTPESALANAGGCALKVGQFERADRDLRSSLSLDPGNAYALAAMAQNEYHQNRYLEARAFTERRLAAAPANPAVLQLASNIEERLGDKAAASRYVQRLRAEFPDSITANPGETTKP